MHLYRTYSLILILICTSGSAQPNSDSLMHVWQNESESDSLRLDAISKVVDFVFLRPHPDSALYYGTEYLNFAQDKEMPYFVARGNKSIAEAHTMMRDFEKAVPYYNKSINQFKEIGDKIGQSDALYGICMIHVRKGQFSDAIEPLKECLVLKTEVDDKKGLARGFNIIGNIYNILGDMPVAHNYLTKALENAKAIGSKSLTANTMNNLGLICQNQGDFERAAEFYTESLLIKEKLNDRIGVARTSANLGNTLSEMGESEKGLEYYAKALEIFIQANDQESVALTYNAFGVHYKEHEQYDIALDYYDKSLTIREEINDQNGIAMSYINIGSVNLNLKKHQTAQSYAKKAEMILKNQGDLDLLMRAHKLSYLSNTRLGKQDAAYDDLNIIMNLIDRNISTNYFAMSEQEKSMYFDLYVAPECALFYDFTVRNHQSFVGITDSAYNIALWNKGLALKSSTAMRQTILASGDSDLITKYKNWLELKEQLSKAYAFGEETKELEREVNKIEKELIKKSVAFSDFNAIKNLKWQNIRDGLENNEVAIEFIHFKSENDPEKRTQYAALLVRKNSEHPILVKLCYENEIEKILGKFQGNNLDYVNTVYGSNRKTKTELYNLIWKPLEPALKGIENIYYSPSGLLHKISFAALGSKKNVFLCDRYNLNQESSTGLLANSYTTSIDGSGNFLLVGGVNYNSDSTENKTWSYLSGSKTETEQINQISQKKATRINYLVGNQATEENIKKLSKNSSIIHIATHGFFFPDPVKIRSEAKIDENEGSDIVFRGTTNYANWSFVNNKNPLMRSGIVLARANDVWQRSALEQGEDGILTAAEVSNMDLTSTELVVLSACETGLGDIRGSEGVFGLQRGFKIAGAKHLIMSLWQVPDNETAEFMTLFYDNLYTLNDIPEAFSKTQKMMRKKYDPYFWAAFVLIK